MRCDLPSPPMIQELGQAVEGLEEELGLMQDPSFV